MYILTTLQISCQHNIAKKVNLHTTYLFVSQKIIET